MAHPGDDDGNDVEIYRRFDETTIFVISRPAAPEHLLTLLDTLGLERTSVVTAAPATIWHAVPDDLPLDQQRLLAIRIIPPLRAAGYRVNIAPDLFDQAAYDDALAHAAARQTTSPTPGAERQDEAPEVNLAEAHGTDIEISHRPGGRVCADTRAEVHPDAYVLLEPSGFQRPDAPGPPAALTFELPPDHTAQKKQRAATRAALTLYATGFQIHIAPDLFNPPAGMTAPVPLRPAPAPAAPGPHPPRRRSH